MEFFNPKVNPKVSYKANHKDTTEKPLGVVKIKPTSQKTSSNNEKKKHKKVINTKKDLEQLYALRNAIKNA